MLERAAHPMPRCLVVSMKIAARAGCYRQVAHSEKGALPPGTCFYRGPVDFVPSHHLNMGQS
jgi:hypothetical protein